MKTLNSEQLTMVISLLDEQIRQLKQRVSNQQETYDSCNSSFKIAEYEQDNAKLNITHSQEYMQKMKDGVAFSLEFLELEKAELNKYEALRTEL